MAKQTGSYDFKAAKAAHDEASQVATNYIFKSTGHDAWVCDEDAGPNMSTGEAYGPNDEKPTTGWRIGSVFELVKQGVSWFKLWVEDTAKLALGNVGSGNYALIDSDSFDIMHAETPITHFGYGEVNSSQTSQSVGDYPYYELGVTAESFEEYQSSGKQYYLGDLMRKDGAEYVCVRQTSGWVPSDWRLLEYDASYQYKFGDLVKYDGDIYVCSYPSSGVWDRADWRLLHGKYSVSESYKGLAAGAYSHAEGMGCKALSGSSHAEGYMSKAAFYYSHAEGEGCLAYGTAAHAEGSSTDAHADYAHAEGRTSKANSASSHAQNIGTIANGKAQTVLGTYNEAESLINPQTTHPSGSTSYLGYAVIVGNGTSDSNRSNALAIGWDGIPYCRNKSNTWGSIFDLVYPVGSIYTSVNSTNPETLFGGTWERITGRFLLAATDNGAQGGNSNASIAPGYTGGEAEHTLTAAESGVPAHGHGFTDPTYKTSGSDGTHRHQTHYNNTAASGTARAHSSNASGYSQSYFMDTGGGHGHTITKNTSGSVSNNTAAAASAAHNNMPPYLAVYVWKRTA